MAVLFFRGRRASSIENEYLRVTVLEGGGHIAEVLDKSTGINPLWVPPWTSMEPDEFRANADSVYGQGVDASLLSGIMGHSLCLDLFGAPSAEEAAAGLAVHGECSVTRFELTQASGRLEARASLPLSKLRFTRSIDLCGRSVQINERVENLLAIDRPLAWTQHVTVGPPFLEKGVTTLRMSGSWSRVYEGQFGVDDYLTPSANFEWPAGPAMRGGVIDLSIFRSVERSSSLTTSLVGTREGPAFFEVSNPSVGLTFSYRWCAEDFPWITRWEENCSRTNAPWLGQTLALGIEFGVSPFPESRRAMTARGTMFGAPVYRWLPARGSIEVGYAVCSGARG